VAEKDPPWLKEMGVEDLDKGVVVGDAWMKKLLGIEFRLQR